AGKAKRLRRDAQLRLAGLQDIIAVRVHLADQSAARDARREPEQLLTEEQRNGNRITRRAENDPAALNRHIEAVALRALVKEVEIGLIVLCDQLVGDRRWSDIWSEVIAGNDVRGNRTVSSVRIGLIDPIAAESPAEIITGHGNHGWPFQIELGFQVSNLTGND